MPLLAPVTSATRPVRSPASAALQVGLFVTSLPGTFCMHRSCPARGRTAAGSRARRLGSGVADVVGGHGAELPGLEVLEGLDDLGAGVHHERTVRVDGLTDGLAPQDEDVERRMTGLLLRVGPHDDRVARTVH